MHKIKRRKKKKTRDVPWSQLCLDVLILILETLSLPDFHRARTVCSTWYSVSKICVAGSRNRYPWLIDFSKCKFFDPGEGRTYKARHLRDALRQSSCLANYGKWFLMMSPRLDFSFLNVFTGERINLPSLSLPVRGQVNFRRKDDGGLLLEHSPTDREVIINRHIKKAVFWIDEKTRDYVVFWLYNKRYLFSYKKGDDSWWHFEGTKCKAMTYKNQKLCVYTTDHYIKIFDYSGDFPNEIIGQNPYLDHPFHYLYLGKTDEDFFKYSDEHFHKTRVAITNSGDVLIVVTFKLTPNQRKRGLFNVFKMNLQGEKWERVDSLGDEMLVYGDGLTLRAADARDAKEDNCGGFIMRDSIYFDARDVRPPTSTGAFNLATAEISYPPSPSGWYDIHWFVPGSDKN